MAMIASYEAARAAVGLDTLHRAHDLTDALDARYKAYLRTLVSRDTCDSGLRYAGSRTRVSWVVQRYSGGDHYDFLTPLARDWTLMNPSWTAQRPVDVDLLMAGLLAIADDDDVWNE